MYKRQALDRAATARSSRYLVTKYREAERGGQIVGLLLYSPYYWQEVARQCRPLLTPGLLTQPGDEEAMWLRQELQLRHGGGGGGHLSFQNVQDFLWPRISKGGECPKRQQQHQLTPTPPPLPSTEHHDINNDTSTNTEHNAKTSTNLDKHNTNTHKYHQQTPTPTSTPTPTTPTPKAATPKP